MFSREIVNIGYSKVEAILRIKIDYSRVVSTIVVPIT